MSRNCTRWHALIVSIGMHPRLLSWTGTRGLGSMAMPAIWMSLRTMYQYLFKLFTLRESQPSHPKTATLAKCTDHPELSVRNADFNKDLRKELSAKNRANEQPPRSAKTSTPRYPPQNECHLRSFALGASCRPMGAIVEPSWGHVGSLLGPLGVL